MTAVDAVSLFIAAWLAGFVILLCGLVAWVGQGISRWRAKRDDEDQRVLDGMDALTAVLPAVDLANPPVRITRSPLARPVTVLSGPRHAADAYARPHNHQPRHGFTTDRDPLMAARIEKTDLFDTNELHAMLDAELVLVQPVRTETGDGWSQPALRLRGLPPVVEDVLR